METTTTVTHRNGGIEQAFLEIASEMGNISEVDKGRLLHLQSLPQNRTEVIKKYNYETKEG